MNQRPLVAALLDRADERANALAITGEDGSLSYRALAAGALRLANDLLAAGLGTNQTVHVRVSNSPGDFVALLGVWLAHGVAVPVHRSSPAAAIERIRERSRASFDIDLLATVRSDRICRYEVAAASDEDERLLANAALVIFTSGSTGAPKGVVLSHDALAGKLAANDSLLHFGSHDRVLLVLNNSFSFGIWVALLTLLKGGTLVTRSRFIADSFVDDLNTERISRVGVVPTMMRSLLARSPRLPLALPDLRQILIGGESLGSVLSARLRNVFNEAELVDIYGLTESATSDFFLFPDDYFRYPAAVGRAAPGVRFRIVDDNGARVAAGSAGELQISSPTVMRGYLGDPHGSDAALAGGWLRTGDLARSPDDRFVEIVGRRKDVIVRGGNKIHPLEIEQQVAAYPGVGEALAVGIADPVLGERIHALIVPRGTVVPDIDDLYDFLADRLDPFKLPDAVYVGAALPLGSTGKADRGQLARLISEGEIQPAWLRKSRRPAPGETAAA